MNKATNPDGRIALRAVNKDHDLSNFMGLKKFCRTLSKIVNSFTV